MITIDDPTLCHLVQNSQNNFSHQITMIFGWTPDKVTDFE